MVVIEIVAKAIHLFSKRVLKRGGETWPGEIVRRFIYKPQHIRSLFDKVILVVGTNGKTSTTKILVQIFKHAGHTVITNASGANLLNGILSSILVQKKLWRNSGYIGVFEVDEFSLEKVSELLVPTHVIILNVVRDQLDRYGEVRNVLSMWQKSFATHEQSIVVANAFDPGVVWVCSALSKKRTLYYGVSEKYLKKGPYVLGDSGYCFFCNSKLLYRGIYVSHIGDWACPQCNTHIPKNFVWSSKDLERLSHIPSYMVINLQGVFLIANEFGIKKEDMLNMLSRWEPAYGRGEVKRIGRLKVTFVLGKNPVSWSVAATDGLQNKEFDIVILGLNNQIPDGRDVSWIWDVEIPVDMLHKVKKIWIYGDRAYDMAVRLQTEGIEVSKTWTDAYELFTQLKKTDYRALIVANYTAMLVARKALLGKAIL